MLPVGITLQNQAQLQLKRKIYIPRLGWNCASKLNTVTTISSFLTTTLELELRYKIKHGYNKWYKKLLSWIVGIALQNQARLQPQIIFSSKPFIYKGFYSILELKK